MRWYESNICLFDKWQDLLRRMKWNEIVTAQTFPNVLVWGSALALFGWELGYFVGSQGNLLSWDCILLVFSRTINGLIKTHSLGRQLWNKRGRALIRFDHHHTMSLLLTLKCDHNHAFRNIWFMFAHSSKVIASDPFKSLSSNVWSVQFFQGSSNSLLNVAFQISWMFEGQNQCLYHPFGRENRG